MVELNFMRVAKQNATDWRIPVFPGELPLTGKDNNLTGCPRDHRLRKE
jgi:hypothetical protein